MFLILSLSLSAGCRKEAAPASTASPAPIDPTRDPVEAGRELTEGEAQALEKKLETDPDDLDARGRLLGFYARARFRSPKALEAADRHALWLILNRPESDAAGHPEVMPLVSTSPRAAMDARRAWLEAAAQHNTDERVLEHAAEALRLYDLAASEAVLLHLQRLDPDSPKRAEALARHYDLAARWGEIPGLLVAYPEGAQAAAAPNAVVQWERYLSRTVKNRPERLRVLGDVARAQFRTGRFDRAEDYAREALAGLEAIRVSSRANAAHQAHQVLGLLAVRAGDAATAKQHLAESARVGLSTRLATQGPSMALARELLEKGERSAVAEYLQACKALWVAGQAELDAWIAEVRAGDTPDFAGRGEP